MCRTKGYLVKGKNNTLKRPVTIGVILQRECSGTVVPIKFKVLINYRKSETSSKLIIGYLSTINGELSYTKSCFRVISNDPP